MIHATEILSRFAADLTFEALPEKVVETTRMYIADYYAACYAGHKVNVTFNRAFGRIFEDMGGKEEATALFAPMKMPAANAAFMNAVHAHGADMDDGNRKAMGHVGAHVISAVFALAETLEVAWKDVIVAVNVGFEVYNRVAAAAQPGLVHRGFHSTGTAGGIACGAACAKLMGLDAEGIYNAMSIAAIQSSGLMLIAESGQACKPINPANAARNGLLAAKLVSLGVAGPVNPLESRKGWFHAMSDETDETMITDGLGEVFTICESYLKPYPSCRHTHCGIEAARMIRGRILESGRAVDERSVRSVRAYIYANAIQIAGQIRIPETADEAKFSIHYSLAAALLDGGYGLEDLESEAVTPARRDIVQRIELIPDETMEDRAAGIRGAKVQVDLTDGTVYEQTVLLPKGDAANPFTWEDIARKMESCMAGIHDREKVKEILRFLRTVEPSRAFTTILAPVEQR